MKSSQEEQPPSQDNVPAKLLFSIQVVPCFQIGYDWNWYSLFRPIVDPNMDAAAAAALAWWWWSGDLEVSPPEATAAAEAREAEAPPPPPPAETAQWDEVGTAAEKGQHFNNHM